MISRREAEEGGLESCARRKGSQRGVCYGRDSRGGRVRNTGREQGSKGVMDRKTCPSGRLFLAHEAAQDRVKCRDRTICRDDTGLMQDDE